MKRHNGIEPDPEGAFVYYADAQAAVEALQRERDQWVQAVGLASTCAGDMEIDVTKPIEMMQVVCQRFATLTAALDAEREKVKALDAMYRQQLEGRDKRIENLAGSAKIWVEKLTQLQALVRAAVERWRAQTNVKEGISFRMAMKALEATLDATTPARQQE